MKQRNFVYHNEVIRLALVGLLRPWISSGVRLSWPQHHRPTTFTPIDLTLEAHGNGVQTAQAGETEPIHGLQMMTGLTLHPDRTVLEIAGRVYSEGVASRHFLW